MASLEGEDPAGCFSHVPSVTGDSAPEEALAASPCAVSACQGPSGSAWPRRDPRTSQGLSLPVPCSSTGHDSDSDSELSLDEQSSSYASSHSSDSEDDGVGAEEKWDPARGAIHSTPKGECVGHTGLGWAVDSRLGAGPWPWLGPFLPRYAQQHCSHMKGQPGVGGLWLGSPTASAALCQSLEQRQEISGGSLWTVTARPR